MWQHGQQIGDQMIKRRAIAYTQNVFVSIIHKDKTNTKLNHRHEIALFANHRITGLIAHDGCRTATDARADDLPRCCATSNRSNCVSE
jgi:hypothetical protein